MPCAERWIYNYGSKSKTISEDLLERMGILFDEPEGIELTADETKQEEQPVKVKANVRNKKAKRNI